MALPASFLSEDQFTCSICLDVFNNPVSTPCGHSFCQVCISSYWDGGRRGGGGGGGAKVYQCPLCKESFRKRPELHINRTLKEITEQFKWLASTGILMDGTDGGVGGEGGGVDPTTNPLEQQPLLSPPQRTTEMPESVFAEMMTRFQQMVPPGAPPTAHPHPNTPQSPGSLNANSSVRTSEHHNPPPPYSPPRRYQKRQKDKRDFYFSQLSKVSRTT